MKAISPATTKMLLKTVRDANTSQELLIGAIYCSAKSIQVRYEISKDLSLRLPLSPSYSLFHKCLLHFKNKSFYFGFQVLHDAPVHERQLEVTVLVQQYQQILSSLRGNAGLATLIEGVGMLTRIVQVKNVEELKRILAKNEMVDALMDLLENCSIDVGAKRTLLPVVVNRIR